MPAARSAYVHVPFCARRCGYCNFTVVAGRDDLVDDYLRAIALELARMEEPCEVDTLYFGGGTPTQLSLDALQRLLSVVRAWHPLAAGGEFTVEANPNDLTDALAALLAGHGVTRISLGAQAFDPGKLALLQRDHRAAQIEAAAATARRHVPVVAVDLISAVPGETLASWTRDLNRAVALGADHVSTYSLTYEKGAAFWSRLQRGELVRCGEELDRAMYGLAIDRLAEAGFDHYEVSSFARPGRRCRHNEVYWDGSNYYAVGPGAARYVDGRREMNHRSTTTYLKRVLAGRSPVAEWETLAPEDRARELLVLGLRRLEGVDRQQFAARTGFALDRLVGRPLAELVDRGLLIDDGTRVRLSRAGLMVSDTIWTQFLRV